MTGKTKLSHRFLSILLCVTLLMTYFPVSTTAATSTVTTVADPETLTRPETIYGDNTLNAGKVTVGKSVSDQDITVNGQKITIDGDNNFLVTISQSAQVMGLSSQTSVPVDVVFVLDTSGSMDDNDRAESLVTAANSAIKTLMQTNEQNRIAVVAFSSEGYGGGTSNDAAANVLSSLAHYTGTAAETHLQWVNENGRASGNNRNYIAGRDTVTVGSGYNQQTRNAYRHGKLGGTNIQAGIAEGAKLLTAVTNTTYTDPDTNKTVTRIPFLIVISDGQPTFSYDDDTWYAPTVTGSNAADEQGPGSGAYEGNGFIAALTAAYYKGKITEHYYGSAASAENHCFVYTMGVEIEALDDTQNTSVVGVNQSLAQITLDPKAQTVGSYAESNAKSYWNYGNTAFETTQDADYGWKTYWNNYLAGDEFSVRVDAPQNQWVWTGQGEEGSGEPQRRDYRNQQAYEEAYRQWWNANYTYTSVESLYTFTAESIAASKSYVNGMGYAGGITYNDRYFAADNVSDMQAIFAALLQTIQEKSISVPTKVTTGDHNFDGYVNFYDPIGEYMEVKDMKGILADGYLYQGVSFAQKLAKFGTEDADEEFDALLVDVVKSRMNLTDSVVDINEFAAKALASENQAYYNGPNDYDNSIVWWGNSYNSGEEDEHVQIMGFADNDTIEYIEAQRRANAIPAGADYVCRSYFFYGEAGGTNPNPDHTYLYFMVRVQRELTAPYKETVVISAPASLLSMEKVLISEAFDEDGNPVYTATVEHQEPARVVYEVGLWDSITSENVSSIVSSEYANETVNGNGSVNYNAATDTYNFFTNDWDRTQTLDSHHRGMAKATFDAAADNAFYTYQQDTLVVDANGNAVTIDPAGTTAYYVREYYEWSADSKEDGTYAATKESTLIKAEIPEDAELVEKDGKWYIPAGVYTAATLVVNGDDTEKSTNATGTSAIVAHPHRTGNSNNSHYTVYLGNNGMLSLKSDPYQPQKTVSVNLPASAVNIVDDEGKAVKIGDVLTYTVEVKNILPYAANITVTDYVPLGTAFVEGSAGSGTDDTGHTKDVSIKPDDNNVLTWVLEDVPAGQTRYISFQATVTESALSLNVVPGMISNTATVQLDNTASVTTNTTYNPPYGKAVTDVNNQDINGDHGFKVGDTLVYHIRFHNNAVNGSGEYVAADVTVTDKIPEGTTFLSADNGGSYNAATGVVTWSFDNMAAGAAKVVSFQVKINASAKAEATADPAGGTEPSAGEIYLPNTATITVENNPDLTTNTTQNWADVGDMTISKLVTAGGNQDKTFTINLTESTGLLSGRYSVTGGDASYVEFANGKGSVSIKHGQTLTIQGLPAGVIITVSEDTSVLPGWTPTYNTQSVTIAKGAATAVSSVSVTNTYTLEPLTVTLKGTKTLQGVALPNAATFGFVAMPDSGNPVVGDPLTGEVTVKDLGAYEFSISTKTFTVPGEYKYTVYELNGGLLGVTYDAAEHVLVIDVVDNGDGTMSASATLDGTAFDFAQDTVDFTNSYTPGETYLELTASKELAGRNLTVGEFQFQLVQKNSTNVYKGISDANGHIVFERIHYTAAGTYEYTLSEVIPTPGAQGITYDTNVYDVQVVVSDVNGQLVPVVTVEGAPVQATDGVADTGITFENTFTPDDIPLILVANKTLLVYDPASNGYSAAAPEAGKFRFQILEKGTNKVVATGTNAADGTITFNPFYFSVDMLEGAASKEFRYVISEVVPELAKDPNMAYDLDGREITATLAYNAATGTLTVTVNGDSDGNVDLTASVDFENYQNPDSVTVTPHGKKTTEGQNLPAGLSFSFAVVPVGSTNDAATGTSNATVEGVDNQTTDITFTSMVYTHASLGGNTTATYQYWILESNAGAASNGVTYDTTRYLYQVTLSRNEFGRLVAQEKYFALAAGGDAEDPADYTVEVTTGITFRNEYDAKAYINLVAGKELQNRTPSLKANEFDFVLHRLDSTGKIVAGSEITGSNDASGAVHFATLNYASGMLDDAYKHEEGIFYFSYLMQEINPEGVAVPGVTYDTAKYVVTVKITQTASDMTAELANVSTAVYKETAGTYTPGTPVTGFSFDAVNHVGNTNVTFTNTYQATQGDVIKYRISKVLEGRTVRAGEFEFGLYLNGQLVDVASNDADGYVTFSRTIPATAAAYAGTYEMVIKELTGTIPGVTYSTESYTIFVKITDTGTGKIQATVHLTEDGPALAEDAAGLVDLADNFIFHNVYEAHDTTFTPTATKTLTGLALEEGEFRFLVTDVTDGSITYRGINEADGTVLFQTIPYTETGVYTYEITEINDGISGIRYDESKYYLQVTVTDDGNGYLKAEGKYYASYSAAQGVSDEITAVKFTNSYVPAGVTVQLEADKALTGRDLVNKEFSFVVHQDNASGKIIATGSNDAEGNILFSTFDITAADMADATVGAGGVKTKTFTYVIMESDNKVPGVTVDQTVRTVTVTVTDDGTGALTAQINYPNSKPIVFTNTYTPASTELPLVAFKTLTGKNLLADEFTFVLKDASGDPIQTVKNDANGVITFQALSFTAEDMVDTNDNKVMTKTFVYTLTEQAGNVDGMAYDNNVYTITVTVTDDGKGNLTAAATCTDTDGAVELIRFVNSYTPPVIDVELEGTKTITDTDGKALTDSQKYPLSGFEFEIRDAKGKLITTAASDDSGKIAMELKGFSAAGEYRFLVSEKTTDKAGYTTDPTIWCVHITIGYNADTGVLYEAGEYIHVAPETHDEIAALSSEELSFVNVYDPADVNLTLKGLKTLDGRELREHEFTFYMVDHATNLRAAESRNHGNGEINFHLTYDKAGTYKYTVYEDIPAEKNQLGGVTYTEKTHDVTVEVTDDGTGALKATVGEITVLGSNTVDLTGSVIFENKYAPDSAEATIEAWKQLDGKELKADAFTFELVNKADADDKYTATNAANGRVTFETITYEEAGTYEYTLSEVKGNAGGVTYDDHVYTVTVTVTDDGNGQLHAVTHYTSSDSGTEAAPVFHNLYNAAPAEYTPEVLKIFEGGDMRTFSFVLSGEGFEPQTKQNNEAGEVTFDKLTFEKAGSYTFTIEEKADPSIDDIRWDTNVYTLVIQVVDDLNGQLVIDEVSITSEIGTNDLTFRNVHEDLITDKDVFLSDDLTVSIDGKTVEAGDILTYTVSYTNYTGKTGDVTITDTIPEHTAYVNGSANNGGTYAGGVLTWDLTDIAPGATVTVSFDVKVTGTDDVVENKAAVLEGSNTYETNTVTNPIEEDTAIKDVFHVAEPTVSIDGETVKKGDILLYKVTYTNSDDFVADVTITDKIPQYSTYVDGSADNGGFYADGVLTWNVNLAAGESITVSFQVKVIEASITVANQASAQEGENKLDTNIVTNPVASDPEPTPEPETPPTGDMASIQLWCALLFISGGGIIGTTALGIRRKETEEE